MNDSEYRYLKRGGRAFRMSRDEVVAVLTQADAPLCEAVIDFQVRFGGYVWTDLTLGLFFPDGLGLKPTAPNGSIRDGRHFFECAHRNISQICYEIDEAGQIFEEYRPSAESFESLIADHAYVETVLSQQDWKHIPEDRLATKRFQGFFDESELTKVPQASDAYRQVLRGDDLVCIRFGEHSRLFVTPDRAKSLK